MEHIISIGDVLIFVFYSIGMLMKDLQPHSMAAYSLMKAKK